ncbi:DUF4249 domain-containing protein [Lewinella sp. W8]|uniref:DUF4249 domain-containing protein n=1 Tax=Lewinella sp. W8 TaxID=2528208 RepID=UPI0015662AEE|nr:DUF4249 domain-containing protein [Lewinella sp. W8]
MFALLLTTCSDPVEPVFRFETGFLLLEGRIVDQEGYSAIRVSRNEIIFGNYALLPVEGLNLVSIDDAGNEVQWSQVESTNEYRPPADFKAEAGRTYYIRAVTPQGEVVESEPERVPATVPIAAARVQFEQEAYFSEGLDRFVPAFRLLVDLDDPADDRNFYQWQYTAWQTIDVCASCQRARWRNGECIPGPDTRFVNRWDYLCDATCWVSSRGKNLNILSDEFSQGRRITGVEAGREDFARPGGLLFEVEQYSISKKAYDYNVVLQNLAEGASGLNAPLPAPLIGNLLDRSENKVDVLGFVGVAALDIERVYLNRDTVNGTSLPYDGQIILEPVMPSPPVAPCEGGTRTRQRPVGWPE